MQLKAIIVQAPLPFYAPDPPMGQKGTFFKVNNDIETVLKHQWGWAKDQIIFLREDVEKIENENPELESGKALSAKERREFGQLKLEKEKWDLILKATALATEFAVKQKLPILKNDLWEVFKANGLNIIDITDRMHQKIWKAIPSRYRHTRGRPKKT